MSSGILILFKINVFKALTFYDLLLTLPLEVLNIWSSEVSVAKIFYYMNRYGFIAYQICQIPLFLAKPNDAVSKLLLCAFFL